MKFSDMIKSAPEPQKQEPVQPEAINGQFKVAKADEDQHLVFGWASVAIDKNGEQIEDWQGDMIDPEVLEKAVYKYVELSRDGGEMHQRNGVATMIESIVFTKEKMAALGIPDGTVHEGWWIGFRVTDPDVWAKVKDGTYKMFSIEGKANREEVPEKNTEEKPKDKQAAGGAPEDQIKESE